MSISTEAALAATESLAESTSSKELFARVEGGRNHFEKGNIIRLQRADPSFRDIVFVLETKQRMGA